MMLAAVARPEGPGPFPTLIVLHGSHGFGQQYVDLALDMARRGVVSVAACWFSGGSGSGSRFITPAVYYEGGHNSPFTSAAQREDEVQRIAAFLRRHVVDKTR